MNMDPPEFVSSTARAVRSVAARGKPTSGRARPMALSRLVLVDSTGFGWLEAGNQAARGAGLADRRNGTVACISCGGSLVKDGQAKVSILWLLKAALMEGFFGDINGDRPVCCRAVPAERSVPGRRYGSLVQARKEWSVAEAGPSIMDSAGARYGGQSQTLHFQPSVAAEGMEDVVAAAVHAFPVRPRDTLDVVLCCGWNCDGATLPLECFAAKTLTAARTWKEFVREVLTQADEREGWGGASNRHMVSGTETVWVDPPRARSWTSRLLCRWQLGWKSRRPSCIRRTSKTMHQPARCASATSAGSDASTWTMSSAWPMWSLWAARG